MKKFVEKIKLFIDKFLPKKKNTEWTIVTITVEEVEDIEE